MQQHAVKRLLRVVSFSRAPNSSINYLNVARIVRCVDSRHGTGEGEEKIYKIKELFN